MRITYGAAAKLARKALDLSRSQVSERHPQWTTAQKRNLLYRQNTVRKRHRQTIRDRHDELDGCRCTLCPEAMGVDVTRTLQDAGDAGIEPE